MMTRMLRYLMPVAVILAAFIGTLAVTPAAPAAAQELALIEITGVIDGLDTSTLLVGRWEVDYAAAELNTALALGAFVKVEGYVLADGVIWAWEVDALEDDDALGITELTGTLTGLTATTAEVAGLTIDMRGAEIAPGVVVGALVKVHAVHDEFGALVAWQIRLADRTADDDSSLGVQLFPRFDDHGHDSINHDANDDHGLFDDDGHVFDDHGHEHGDDD